MNGYFLRSTLATFSGLINTARRWKSFLLQHNGFVVLIHQITHSIWSRVKIKPTKVTNVKYCTYFQWKLLVTTEIWLGNVIITARNNLEEVLALVDLVLFQPLLTLNASLTGDRDRGQHVPSKYGLDIRNPDHDRSMQLSSVSVLRTTPDFPASTPEITPEIETTCLIRFLKIWSRSLVCRLN